MFLILIAVALFAGLSYVVTSSSRSGSGNTEKERADLTAAEILNYATNVSTAAARLVPGGCLISQISFEKAPFDGSDAAYVNPASPDTEYCHVFSQLGGGAFEKNVPVEWLDTTHAAEPFYGEMPILITCLTGYGTDPATDCNTDGTLTADIVMFIPYLKQTICEALADRMHPDDGIIVDTNDAFEVGSEYDGTFINTTASIDQSGNPGRNMPLSGCIVGDGGGTNLEADEYAFYTAVFSQ